MTVAATGTGPLTYQWYEGATGTTTSPIALATGTSFTTPPVTTTSSYWVRVTNAAGHADSNTATLIIGLPPTIVIEPQSTSVGRGVTATMSVVASGTPPFTYQWYLGTSGTTADADRRRDGERLHDASADDDAELLGPRVERRR